MRILKYFVLTIHILAAIVAGVYFLNTDHIVMGEIFSKCLEADGVFYLEEDARNYSVLYRENADGTVSHIYTSNSDKSGVSIEDFTLGDEIYLLEKHKNGYSLRKISRADLTTISKSPVFNLTGIDEITDFVVNINDNIVKITAIADGRMRAFGYEYSLLNLVSIQSDKKDSTKNTEITELSPVVIYNTSENGPIETGYFDGSSFISGKARFIDSAVDPVSYKNSLELTHKQSFMVNIPLFIMLFAYVIIGIFVILLIASLIEKRRRFLDLLLINEVLILGIMCSIVLVFGEYRLALIWVCIASLFNLCFVLLQNQDIMVLCKDMGNISAGNFSLTKPLGTSKETLTLWRGMNEVKYLYETYKYIQETTMAAVVRFLPHNLVSMFKAKSLDELKPGGSVSVSGTLMSLKVGQGITNEMVGLVENYERKAGGTLLTTECSSSEIKMLFTGEDGGEVTNGLVFYSDLEDKKACSLYFKDVFTISVVGTQTKSILDISSRYMNAMDELAHWFYRMGLRMVISDEVKNAENIDSPLRTIGYCIINGEKHYFHEVLNAYEESVRGLRLSCLSDFNSTMELFYQENYYLARTGFSDILKIDPRDELSRWYLFVCEKYLNDPDITVRSCALDPRN